MSAGEESAFREGDHVRVTGLKAQVQLNGKEGKIIEWDPAEKRWKVHMDDGTGKMLRTCNLEALPGRSSGDLSKTSRSQPEPNPSPEAAKRRIAANVLVRVKGLKVRSELNGLQGVITAWDPIEDSWSVRLHGAEASAQNLYGVVKNFREENLEAADPSESQSSAEPFVKSIEPRARVEVIGLQVRPDLNGSAGEVVEWDEKEQRWKVLLDDGTGKLLKESNLKLLNAEEVDETNGVGDQLGDPGKSLPESGRCWKNGDRVCVKGLQVQRDLNGQCGILLEFDQAEGRWKVRMDDGSGKLLREGNLEPVGPGKPAAAQASPVQAAPLQAAPLQATTTGRLSGSEPATSSPDTSTAFREGDRVRVTGLKARTDLNGKEGKIVEWDPAEERWKVHMDDGSGKMLRTCHLEMAAGPEPGDLSKTSRSQPSRRYGSDAVESQNAKSSAEPFVKSIEPGARVEVLGLQVRPDLNGSAGMVVEWDEKEQRWKVLLDDGTGKLLKESNLKLIHAEGEAGKSLPESERCWNSGDRVRVKGLQVQRDLNGQCGILLEWDQAEGRWKVRMDDGSGKLLREENLEPVCPGKPAAAQASPVQAAPLQATATDKPAAAQTSPVQAAPLRAAPVQAAPVQAAPVQAAPVPATTTGARLSGAPALPPRHFDPQDRVRVVALQTQPALNGSLGTILEWEAEQERWKVLMDDGAGKLFRPANLEPFKENQEGSQPPAASPAATEFGTTKMFRPINLDVADSASDETIGQRSRYELQPGSRIQVVDLKRQKERNASKGTALEWVEQIERWKVVLDDGSSLLLRTNHLLPIGRGWDSTSAQTCE